MGLRKTLVAMSDSVFVTVRVSLKSSITGSSRHTRHIYSSKVYDFFPLKNFGFSPM